MKILVINAGSSSLKYQLFNMEENLVMAKGNCERIGVDGKITHKRPGFDDYKKDIILNSHDDAIKIALSILTDANYGVIKSINEIDAVGHRVAHGGERYKKSSIIDDEALKYLYSIVDINPLHGPPAIKGIEACRKLMKEIPQVGVFDTSFYGSMEEYSYIYPIPYEYYERYKIRRYGFHGTSHRYVSSLAADMMGKHIEELKIITCHIGNGSSITAIMNGKAIDTSMGFTPQEGLPMGTRSGSLDPTIIPYIMKVESLSIEDVEDIINRKSGFLGIYGKSSDSREINDAAAEGDKRARLALNILNNRIKKIIGSYVAEMNGIDALVFTAGIGENDPDLRRCVCMDMNYLGIQIDEEKNANKKRGENLDISASSARVKTFVISTDEEYMIAIDTKNLVSN